MRPLILKADTEHREAMRDFLSDRFVKFDVLLSPTTRSLVPHKITTPRSPRP